MVKLCNIFKLSSVGDKWPGNIQLKLEHINSNIRAMDSLMSQPVTATPCAASSLSNENARRYLGAYFTTRFECDVGDSSDVSVLASLDGDTKESQPKRSSHKNVHARPLLPQNRVRSLTANPWYLESTLTI